MSWQARENAWPRATFRLTPAGRGLFILSTTRFTATRQDKTNWCADDSTALPTTQYSAAWERYSTFTVSSTLILADSINMASQHSSASDQSSVVTSPGKATQSQEIESQAVQELVQKCKNQVGGGAGQNHFFRLLLRFPLTCDSRLHRNARRARRTSRKLASSGSRVCRSSSSPIVRSTGRKCTC